MANWRRQFQSIIRYVENTANASIANTASVLYHSEASLVVGTTVFSFSKPSNAFPSYHYLQKLGYTSLRKWLGDSSDAATALALNSRNCDTQKPVSKSEVRTMCKCIQQSEEEEAEDFQIFRAQMPPYFFMNLRFSGRTFCSVSTSKKHCCWNCDCMPGDDMMPFLVCNFCKSVQPVNDSIDYFQIFRLEREYEIEENLEGRYKDWQKKLHPDLVHSKSEKEREYAAEQSARVIDAYRTLTNPLSRAIYIMKLEGVEVDEEERIYDPELLAEIMEIREAVEETKDIRALNELQGQIQGKLKHWCKCFANAFKCKKYDEALISIRKMTYYKRAIEEIVKKL